MVIGAPKVRIASRVAMVSPAGNHFRTRLVPWAMAALARGASLGAVELGMVQSGTISRGPSRFWRTPGTHKIPGEDFHSP